MKVNIMGFNIFNKGGTTRSNINLINAFQEGGYDVTYFNEKPIDTAGYISLVVSSEMKGVDIKDFSDFNEIADGDVLIITRESQFVLARNIKAINPNIIIVGEIHGPLAYIDDSIDLALDSIDSIRVSTDKIKEEFIKKYSYGSVFNNYVNTRHIKFEDRPKTTKRNFLVKSRFEDGIKDISYVIKLFNYIIKNYDVDIQLYLIGYGPSETLYKNLINYYGLKNHVYLNEREPYSYIYMATSPYETLSYSILETIGSGNKALIYPGNDDVLRNVYEEFKGVDFLTKNIEQDSTILLNFLDTVYNQEDRDIDVELYNKYFNVESYADNFISNMKKSIQFNTFLPVTSNIVNNRSNKNSNLLNLDNLKEVYKKLKKIPLVGKVFKSKLVFDNSKKYYSKHVTRNIIKELDSIKPKDDHVFIESFHGSNFSGDPKYIALEIAKNYDKKIFVSSRNSLVDLEIRSYGFTPLRLGSKDYVHTFRTCKYVFINGNTLDKVYKHDEQVFIQTWHGFPLKRMIFDLSDEKERKIEGDKFKPRMQKWDQLIVSSRVNEMLLDTAFKLDNNSKLNILREGAPRNSYLINHKDDENEKKRIQLKYMFNYNPDVEYVLYCPTWRKSKRKDVTNIDLEEVLKYLPENYEIIIKLHPNESHLRSYYAHLDKRIHCFFNELVDIQELYLISKCMITDYSSTIFDYAHLNKPIFILQEDGEDYLKSIGFYFDLFDIGTFPVASTNERKLANQIKSLKQINYEPIINTLMEYDRHNSGANILNKVIK